MAISLLSQLGDVSTECTAAGFEPMCYSFAYNEISALF